MKPQTYIYYLEAVVLSLLAERQDVNADILSVDKHPSFNGCSFSPYIVLDEIAKHRGEKHNEEVRTIKARCH